jgi:L-arabinonolactonase
VPDGEPGTLKLIAEPKCQSGKCPLWDDRRQALYWTDILTKKVFMLNFFTGAFRTVKVPELVGNMALCESGDRILLCCETHFAYLYFDTMCYERLKSNYERQGHQVRFNDGRVDRQGRFVSGNMQFNYGLMFGPPQMKCYQINLAGADESIDLDVKEVKNVPLVSSTNGVCFSLCGKYMYHAESREGILKVLPYDSDLASTETSIDFSIVCEDEG